MGALAFALDIAKVDAEAERRHDQELDHAHGAGDHDRRHQIANWRPPESRRDAVAARGAARGISIRILSRPRERASTPRATASSLIWTLYRLTACLTGSRLHAKPTDDSARLPSMVYGMTALGCVKGAAGEGRALPLWLSVACPSAAIYACLGDAGSELGNVKVDDVVRHVVHGEPFRDIFLNVDRAVEEWLWDWTGTPATVRPGPRRRPAV